MYSFLLFQVWCDSKVSNVFHFCNLPITPIMEIQTEVSKPISIKCLVFVTLLLNVILKMREFELFVMRTHVCTRLYFRFFFCVEIYSQIIRFSLQRIRVSCIYRSLSKCRITFDFYNLFPNEYERKGSHRKFNTLS